MSDVLERPVARHGVRDPEAARHSVTFDTYVDVRCADDGGEVLARAFMLVHHAIVAGARVAVAFPEQSSAGKGTLGRRLRIVGSADDVKQAVGYAQRDGLTLRAIAYVDDPRPVPEGAAGVAFVRARDAGFGAGELRRRDERARRKRKAGNGYMEEADIRNRRASASRAVAEAGRRGDPLLNAELNAPSLTLVSGSTRKPFRVHVERRALPVSAGPFGSYGLSAADPDTGVRGAVPDFE